MKRAMLFAFVLALVPLGAAGQAGNSAEPSTILLLNGKIFTGDPAQPFVEAVKITGDKITNIGSTAEVRRHVGLGTRVIDLQGRTAIPGINDAHLHPGDEAFGAVRLDVGMDPTLANLEAAVAGAIDETPADLFILVTVGPIIINNRNVDRGTLDALGKGRRVMLSSFTGHGLIMSTGAMSALGIELNSPNPPGGSFGRDANGVLNGRASEYAQYAIERKLFDQAGDAEIQSVAASFGDTLVRLGITSIQAMPAVREDRFIKAWNNAGVPVRLRVMEFPFALTEAPSPGINGVKWILDGTPIEHGAALRTNTYSDQTQGRLNFDDIRPHLEYARRRSQQVLLHAAGDKTVAQVLETIDKLKDTFPLTRPRIEHGDGLQRDLIPAAKKLGVVVVQNPTHFPFQKAYPGSGYMLAKSLVAAGIPLAIGSDGPLNPYLNIMEAVDRADDSEELTREQAVTAYTSGSAFAESKETEKGKILPGFLADIAVLSQDIFTVPLGRLPDTTSVLTIIGGKVVHSEL